MVEFSWFYLPQIKHAHELPIHLLCCAASQWN